MLAPTTSKVSIDRRGVNPCEHSETGVHKNTQREEEGHSGESSVFVMIRSFGLMLWIFAATKGGGSTS